MDGGGKEKKCNYVFTVKLFTYSVKSAKSASFPPQSRHQIFCQLHQ